MQNALDKIDQMQQEQEKIAGDVEEMGNARTAAERDGLLERMDRVLERKDELAGQTAALESQIEQMARQDIPEIHLRAADPATRLNDLAVDPAECDDEQLRVEGCNRVFDTLESEESLDRVERFVCDLFDTSPDLSNCF